ncbi:MAG: DUF4349 domain-containing protein [Chlorobiales bacterium]|nr:DUF4349 domain-containing protein [Chlorobiales bacterium]
MSHFIFACSEKQDEDKSAQPSVTEALNKGVFTEGGGDSEAGFGGTGGSPSPRSTSNTQAADGEVSAEKQKLIKTGSLKLEVDSVETSIAKAKVIIGRYLGYVSESHVSKEANYGETPYIKGTLTLQIPADKFDDAVSSLKTLGSLKEESISTEDVTKAYFDLETRLRVKRDSEERLRTLLKTRTGDVSQVLEVERELERLTVEIEDLLGSKRYYDQKIAFSTLHCELRTTGSDGDREKPGFFTEIRNAFDDFFTILSQSLGGLIRMTAAVIPWLPLVFVTWKGITFLRRRQKEKKQAKPNS